MLVIRNEGPRGGPGMREMLGVTALIYGQGMGEKVALLTDGRFSGATRGMMHRLRVPGGRRRRPDRAQDGDRIGIDAQARTCTSRSTTPNSRAAAPRGSRGAPSASPASSRSTRGWSARRTSAPSRIRAPWTGPSSKPPAVIPAESRTRIRNRTGNAAAAEGGDGASRRYPRRPAARRSARRPPGLNLPSRAFPSATCE